MATKKIQIERQQVGFRFFADERARWEKCAQALRVTFTEWVRGACLEREKKEREEKK